MSANSKYLQFGNIQQQRRPQRPVIKQYPNSQQQKPLRQPLAEIESSTTQKQTSSINPLKNAAAEEQSLTTKFELNELHRNGKKRHKCTLGYEIPIETNHLSLSIKPKHETAIHYNVVIAPDQPKRMMRRVWNEFMLRYFPNSPAAFDNAKSVYAPTMVFGAEASGEVDVTSDYDISETRKYNVCVKFAATINLQVVFDYMRYGGHIDVVQDALQCIDVVLRNATSARFVRIGRSVFSPSTGRILDLGNGMEMWYGHFQSTLIGWKPFLNVDISHKTFPKSQLVSNLMCDIAYVEDPRRISFNDELIKNITTYLNGLQILYECPNMPQDKRKYRVNSLVGTPVNEKFLDKTEKMTTVLDYFGEIKKYRIRYPNLPLIWVGSKDKHIYYPPELCMIVKGQVTNKKLSEVQTSKMIKSTSQSTRVRKENIMRNLRQMDLNSDSCVQAFGLNITGTFEKLTAHVLQPPTIQYAREQKVTPYEGKWRAYDFLESRTLSEWTILNMNTRLRSDYIENFIDMFYNGAQYVGLRVLEMIRPYETCALHDNYMNELQYIFMKLKTLDLVFVIIPEFPTGCYTMVKQIAELSTGCLTQCIRSTTIQKINPATISNILLKINAKLNGRNHCLASVSKPLCLKNKICIIFGADVTHQHADQQNAPSVAAVAASYDPTAFQYNFCWRLQAPKQEIIGDLKNIVREQLFLFYKRTDQKPQHIIFFRDGVSDGQFKQVLNEEIMAIRDACATLGNGSYKPPITFLVVQKRHHTRFFPKNPGRDSRDRNENVPAGTLVDTDIVHPTAIEYYLVSHASIQGVARPTKYRMLWDDAGMNDEEIQTLTYYLCYMFSRCTRSVSYPAPTYYAHLAATRARVYIEGIQMNLEYLDQEQKNITIDGEFLKRKPMFFV